MNMAGPPPAGQELPCFYALLNAADLVNNTTQVSRDILPKYTLLRPFSGK